MFFFKLMSTGTIIDCVYDSVVFAILIKSNVQAH